MGEYPGILYGEMMVPQNMVMDLNNVMYVLYIYIYISFSIYYLELIYI